MELWGWDGMGGCIRWNEMEGCRVCSCSGVSRTLLQKIVLDSANAAIRTSGESN